MSVELTTEQALTILEAIDFAHSRKRKKEENKCPSDAKLLEVAIILSKALTNNNGTENTYEGILYGV